MSDEFRFIDYCWWSALTLTAMCVLYFVVHTVVGVYLLARSHRKSQQPEAFCTNCGIPLGVNVKILSAGCHPIWVRRLDKLNHFRVGCKECGVDQQVNIGKLQCGHGHWCYQCNLVVYKRPAGPLQINIPRPHRLTANITVSEKNSIPPFNLQDPQLMGEMLVMVGESLRQGKSHVTLVEITPPPFTPQQTVYSAMDGLKPVAQLESLEWGLRVDVVSHEAGARKRWRSLTTGRVMQ